MAVTTAQLDTRLKAAEDAILALQAASVRLTAQEAIDLVKAAGGLGNGSSGTGQTTGGTTTAPPGDSGNVGSTADTNIYPLTLSAPDANGTQTAGEGPNQLDFYLASNPGGGYTNNVVILVNGKAVIAPNFTVTSMSGLSKAGANHLVLKGPWGSNPKVQIKGVAPNGINGLWMNGCTIDYVDLVGNGIYDSRGGVSVNAVQVWVSNGADITLTLPQAVATTGQGASATETIINSKTPAQLMASAAPGSTLTLPTGIIVGSGAVLSAATIAGAGEGKTIVDASNLPLYQGKGIIVPAANGVVIQDMTIQNAYIPAAMGLNGAGVRNNDASVGFTLDGVEITGCQNGVLTDAATDATITFKNCHFHGNGEVTQPGNTHEMYIGGAPSGILNLSDSTFEGCRDGHEVKCRMGTVNATNCTVVTGGNGSGYDIPNGGNLNITGGSTALGGSMADRFLIGHAMENQNNAAIGHTVHVKDHVFHNASGQSAIIQTGDPDGILILDNCTYTGSDISLIGWKTVTGALTKST